jgi:polysaccharide export outer membrane protein
MGASGGITIDCMRIRICRTASFTGFFVNTYKKTRGKPLEISDRNPGTWHRLWRVMTLLACCAALSGCATLLAPPPAHPPAPVKSTRAAADAGYHYRIGSGDTLNISVWQNPDLSITVAVRPDGLITVPLIEDLPAEGKDATTLARDIERALSAYLKEPVVSVMVTSFTNPTRKQVRVLGEVGKPQALPFLQNMTLLDVMIAAGGLGEFADGNAATLVRTSESNKRYQLRLHDLMKLGDMSADIEMVPGDVLVIPESWF